ncbi:guanitoxin biosynthesis MATE family efflux transporter GntT [Almyronema epifaneia]|uniref:Guanitoxin biosynthesis MATE family efflux transporter GntT n=1 Tax=Almyronema epifaneia S1 TaxID=2991925 RepID=A0ABW6IE03_9CYAN
MPLTRRFSQLAIANIVSNLMVPLAGIVDTAFLGHLAEIHYLAGVALATLIFNVIYWSFGFLRMGTTGMTAQAMGRGDRSEVLLVGLRNALIALGLGVIILLLQVPLRLIGFALLSGTPDVQAAGVDFYNARIWGSPAVLLNYVLLGWFLGRSQGRSVILLSMVANFGNVVLDYWFINRLGWASAGAGLATALSQYAMLMIGLGLLIAEVTVGEVKAVWPHLWQPQALQGLFLLNRDILIRTFALVISFALFTNFSSILGETVLAVNTLLLQVVTLAAYFIDGIAFATETFAGEFYAQGDRRQLQTLIRLAGGTSLVLGVGFALGFALLPQGLFGIMTSHTVLLNQVESYVWWLLPVLGFGAIAFMLDGYFLGLTAGAALRNSTLLASTIGFLPLAWLALQLKNVQLLWLALTCFMAMRAITLSWGVSATLSSHPSPKT